LRIVKDIWIGTKKGTIDKYDPLTSKFISWKLESELTGEISVKSICEDKEGSIWIGTYKGGLYKLDQTTGKIKNWKADPAFERSLSSNYNLSVIDDVNGNIIIGTYSGLNILNPLKEDQGFRKIYFDPNNENSLSNNIIWALSKSSIDSNLIYIGTSNHISTQVYGVI